MGVGGWELEVLRGLSIEKHRTQVLVTKSVFNVKECLDYMKSISYILWRRIRPNDVDVRTELIKPVETYFLLFYKLLMVGRN